MDVALVFSVRDPNGHEVVLSRSRWRHILNEHPNLAKLLADLRATVQDPHVIQVKDEAVNPRQYRYYRRFRKGYLLLIVKEGKPRRIWTAWYSLRIREGGRYEWLSLHD